MTNQIRDKLYAPKPRMISIVAARAVVALSSHVPSTVAYQVRRQVGRVVPLVPRRVTRHVRLALYRNKPK